MIYFTGSGSLAEEYQRQFQCRIISARSLSDDKLENEIKQATVIIHNSANINCKTFSEAINDNFLLTRRVLDLTHRVNPDALFIYISSMSMLETENSYKEVRDMTLYAFSKYLAEIYCLRHDHKKVSAVRFSTLFYRNPVKDGLSKLIHDAVTKKEITLYNDGLARRDFIPLETAVQYLNKMTSIRDVPREINIASGTATSFQWVAGILSNRIPQLKVNNLSVAATGEILSAFSKNKTDVVGEINFSLEDKIIRYINDLMK